MNITCNRSEVIDLSDPAKIINTDITCGLVAGVPTVMLLPDTLVKHKDAVRDAMDDAVEEAVAAEKSRHGWTRRLWNAVCGRQGPFTRGAYALQGRLAQSFKNASAEMARFGIAIPVANITLPGLGALPDASLYGREYYTPLRAAVVTLPSAGMRLDDLYRFRHNFTRLACPELHPGDDVFRYAVTCHEVGHVAGGGEAHADMISALFTRRAFGDTPLPQMMADFRAVDIIMGGAFALSRNRDPQILSNAYGWEMVTAVDEACAMKQKDIAAMSDADILDNVFTKRPRDAQRSELLMRLMFHELSVPGVPRPWHMIEVVDAAMKTEVAALKIGDDKLIAMAHRLGLAARRVTEGNKAYGI